MTSLFLHLQAKRQTIERDFGADTFDCAYCQGNKAFQEARYCWQDNDRRAIHFGPDLPPSVLSKRELTVLLPLKMPMDFLLNSPLSPSIEGKMVCPVPLAENPDAIQAIQMECDMSGGEGGWNALPFAGPTQTWPLAVLNLLRHIRSVKGQIQAHALDVIDKQNKEANADNN